ncbi:hypothetical protein ACQP6C_08190 [Snodgrassella alvi]|uniref:hypothetical protein n=1 Tax=Snodgrassella alvi TaxID=1196083 RepID=UPI003CFDEBE7
MSNQKLGRQVTVLKVFKAAVDAAADTRKELTNAAFCRDYFQSLFNSFDLTESEAVAVLVALAAAMDDKKFCTTFACSSDMLADNASDSELIHAIKSDQDIWDLL